ncbi:unnamed protein product [Caenorhabditis bovis]|uniref:Homeobox domain-containing protein n=1 Tax=Caenorhabditis bovis TaxID=2654633 RepID=A0A8S1EZX8_9PELO|nr:unnamed protein product [Caenorhabditis bovis]
MYICRQLVRAAYRLLGVAAIYECVPSSSEDRRIRRNRTAFTDEQLKILESMFEQCQYPDIAQREKIGKEIELPEARIQVWFKNRRAKQRKRQRNESPIDDDVASPDSDENLKKHKENTIITWTPGAALKSMLPTEPPHFIANPFLQYYQNHQFTIAAALAKNGPISS